MQKKFMIMLGGLALALVILFNGLFIVTQIEQGIVLRLGGVSAIYTEPGLKFKIPFLDEVRLYEKRVLNYDLPPVALTTADRQRIEVEVYTRYRINDVLLFFKKITPATEVGIHARLEAIVNNSVRDVLGRTFVKDLLSDKRGDIMQKIYAEVQQQTERLGLELIDVRIVRTEFPEKTRASVFGRMNAELQKIAKRQRAEGNERAQRIRAEAERERTTLLAKAEEKALALQGEGDAIALTEVMNAISEDEDFYEFYRSMQTYETALSKDTTMVLTSKHPFMKHMQQLEKNK
jgi:membrane protease subunit HflC